MLHRHNYLYYVKASPEISDYDYDCMLRELESLEQVHPEFSDPSSPTQRIGSDSNQQFARIKHRYPMLSLANTYSEEELREFDQRTTKLLGQSPEYVCELKYDGVAIGLTYQNGKLIRAVTRGDGTVGDDVTANVKTIRTIPLKLQGSNYPDSFEIRGEIFMPVEVFNRLNSEREEVGESPFANPRNAAAGTLKLLNSAEVARRNLDCMVYFILGESLPYTNHFDNLTAAAEWGFKISDSMQRCRGIDEVIAFIGRWADARKKLPYETDGVVIKVNRHDQQQALGMTAKNPRWAIAYKYKPERISTELLSVDFQVGRTGAVTPVANLRPISLGGTTVKRASMHNAEQIALLDIRIGDWVFVEKGGEIIPKIIGVDTAKRNPDSLPVQFPTHCPQCGTTLVKPEGEARHFCPNRTGCPPQIKGRIVHFISRKALNIDGFGEETVARLYEKKLINNPADLYNLTFQDLLTLEGFAEKSAENALASIEKSKSVPFDRVLYGIGIRYVGETTAKQLARHFVTIEALGNASKDKLMEVEDVGERIADSIVSFFSNPANIELIERLKTAGLQLRLTSRQLPKGSDRLQGMKIVISGTFTRFSRDELKELITLHGGKNVGSVSGSTDLLVAGANMGPAKLEKAQKLQIRMVSETEFLKLLGID